METESETMIETAAEIVINQYDETDADSLRGSITEGKDIIAISKKPKVIFEQKTSDSDEFQASSKSSSFSSSSSSSSSSVSEGRNEGTDQFLRSVLKRRSTNRKLSLASEDDDDSFEETLEEEGEMWLDRKGHGKKKGYVVSDVTTGDEEAERTDSDINSLDIDAFFEDITTFPDIAYLSDSSDFKEDKDDYFEEKLEKSVDFVSSFSEHASRYYEGEDEDFEDIEDLKPAMDDLEESDSLKDLTETSSLLLNFDYSSEDKKKEDEPEKDEDVIAMHKFVRVSSEIEASHMALPDERIDRRSLSSIRMSMRNSEREIIEANQKFIMVDDFLNKLIEAVVASYEEMLQKTRISALLDKPHMLKDYYLKREDLKESKFKHAMLMQLIGGFLRKKKRFDCFKEDKSAVLEFYKKLYEGTSQRLDKMLGKKHRIQSIAMEKIYDLKMDRHGLEQEIASSKKEFVQMMRHTLKVKKYPLLEQAVQAFIKNINEVETETSSIRRVFIEKLHVLGVLEEKIAAMKNLGTDIDLETYENWKAHIERLEKDVEERTHQLARYRMDFFHDVHVHAHFEEYTDSLKIIVEDDKMLYDSLNENLVMSRHILANLRKKQVELQKIRLKNADRNFTISPLMVSTFESDCEKIQEAKLRVQALRDEVEHLQDDIDRLTVRRPSTTSNKTRRSTYTSMHSKRSKISYKSQVRKVSEI